MKCQLLHHPRRHLLQLLLSRHPLVAPLDNDARDELYELVVLQEGQRGERLVEQGGQELRQFFVLEGLLKRVVTSAQGREMTLRFAGEGDFETFHDARRRHLSAPYAVICAARSCVAWMPMSQWCAFLESHPAAQALFQERVVALGETMVEHAVSLLLLDAPGRFEAFQREHPQLTGRLVQKDLASHLNLSAETLSRLSRRCEVRAA